MQNITIIGAGAFGFALAKHLSDKLKSEDEIHKTHIKENSKILIYDVDQEIIDHINTKRTQKNFFPETVLNEYVTATTDIKKIANSNCIIIAIPTQFIRSFLENAKPYLNEDVLFLNASKGIELSTHKLISDILEEELGNVDFAALSGGMIAGEFVSGFGIFGAEIASTNKEKGKYLQHLFSSKKLRVYLNDDVKGVESAGALKNVISIAAGIVDGLKYPYGSKTFIVSLGAKDLMNLSLKLGAKPHTFNFYTQAFGNDYLMSTTGNTRNRYYGELIGKGMTPEDAIEQMKKEKKTAEGYYTLKAAYELARKFNLTTPIIDLTYSIVYNNSDPKEEIAKLMASELEAIEDSSYN